MQKPQVFLLPFAGGNCYSYDFLRQYLGGYEFVPLELPGRGKRVKEKLIHDFDGAATDMFNQVLGSLKTTDFVLYGHSLGAVLALTVTHLLEQVNKPPLCMVVSGNPGPGIKDYSNKHTLPKEAFVTELKNMGGFPLEFFHVEDLFNFFEPILRADFALANGDSFNSAAKVHIPVYAAIGSREEFAKDINNWKQYTSSLFKGEILEGDHFFIHHHAKRIAEIIRTSFVAINHF
jgi:external thioesterase TEII